MRSERWVKEHISALLRKYHVYYFMPAMGTYGRAGVSDYVCCIKGKFLAIEAKSEIGAPTALQILELEKVVNAGGRAMIVNDKNLDALEQVLQEMMQ